MQLLKLEPVIKSMFFIQFQEYAKHAAYKSI